jgi:manganese transport protein
MGPSWIISAVACGPATLASVSIAGSLYGYKVLWVVVLSALLAFVAQFMAAKAGILTKKGLVGLVHEKMGPAWAWILMIDALLATWLASAILMKALVDVTGLITGLKSFWWAPFYALAIFLAVGLGGYRTLELISKSLVALVVVCFMITVGVVRPALGPILSGLIPTIPAGVESAVMLAGIMGGAVHITIITMHSYNVNARGWGRQQMGLAWTDTFLSMFVAFGLYSVAIYLAAAAVLHPQSIKVRHALQLAEALKPFLGPMANGVLMAGIWGAVISTITPTFLAAGYFLSDKMGWATGGRDNRFLAVVAAGCLISLIGPSLKGSFLILLVLMLALGLCGTPFVLVLLMLLLNREDVVGRDGTNGVILNALGGVCLAVTTFLAIRFMLSKLGLLG